jgi:hypothetical protein
MLHTYGTQRGTGMHSGDGNLVILKGQEVSEILDGRELDLMAIIRKAYETHAGGDASLLRSAEQNHCVAGVPGPGLQGGGHQMGLLVS